MKCPFCTHLESKVIDSRLNQEANITRRRRECESCGKRFTTHERLEEVLPMVVKKDGRRENFDRQKIIQGLTSACQKRPISMERIEGLVDEIEGKLQERGEKEVTCKWIGNFVMEQLHQLDPVAYVRFASVYRSFKDVTEFMEELKGILDDKKNV